MSIQRNIILNTLDMPLKILFWTGPELMMLTIPIFIGLVISQLILGFFVVVIYLWLSKLYSKNFGKGQLQVVMYWFLPHNKYFKSLPCSFIREYMG